MIRHARHQQVCILSLLADIHTGMSSEKPLDLNGYKASLSSLSLDRSCKLDAKAAGAADRCHTLFLRVHVDHRAGCDQGFVQSLGAVKPDFLFCRKYTFHWRMLKLFIIQHHHHQGNRHAVIGTKCRAVSRENPVLYNQADPIFLKIVLHTGALVAHHIKMSLEHDRSFILRAFAAAFFDDNIIRLILVYPQSPVFCEFDKVVADLLLISRSSRDRADLLKKVK